MVVKEKRGRRRYVAFRSQLPRQGVLGALRSGAERAGIRAPKLIQYDGSWGIVRCAPGEKDAVIAILDSLKDTESLLTSGTLRTLRERFGE